jgi:hypothetical protein
MDPYVHSLLRLHGVVLNKHRYNFPFSSYSIYKLSLPPFLLSSLIVTSILFPSLFLLLFRSFSFHSSSLFPSSRFHILHPLLTPIPSSHTCIVGEKRPDRGAMNSPPYSVAIKNARNYTSSSPIRLHSVELH